MKYSEAMLEGFKKVDGKQCRGLFVKMRNGKVIACCVLGAIYEGRGDDTTVGARTFEAAFEREWGVSPVELNDKNLMDWRDIYGMAVAAGL